MQARDEAAIGTCIPSLRRYARGLADDADRADDLVQDTLERAWRSFSMWQRRGEIRAWLFGILHNRFVDRLQAQDARPESSACDDLPESVARAARDDRLELRDLERALQRLAPEQREVLVLVGVEDLGYAKAARVVGEAELHAYVDGQLPAARRESVEAFLALHETTRQRVDDRQR